MRRAGAWGNTRDRQRLSLAGALGGRAAEEIVYGDVTSGGESDLDHVTMLARQMVGRWGMSERIGPITVLPPVGEEQNPFDATGPGQATREIVDQEARRIIDECYAEALRILREHRANLETLARRLLESETLDEHDAYAAAGLSPPAAASHNTSPTRDEVPWPHDGRAATL